MHDTRDGPVGLDPEEGNERKSKQRASPVIAGFACQWTVLF
jgi:hypothetical protein